MSKTSGPSEEAARRAGARVLAMAAIAAAALGGCDPCADLEDDARTLVDEAAACELGDTCELVLMGDLAGANNCLGPFQCARAFNAKVDLHELKVDAREIVDDYRDCGKCVQASCEDPSTLYAACDGERGRCELYPIPTE